MSLRVLCVDAPTAKTVEADIADRVRQTFNSRDVLVLPQEPPQQKAA